MPLYLSSYKIGNKAQELKQLIATSNKKMGYIPNALDYTQADPERRKAHIQSDVDELKELGANVEVLDLKDYFGKQKELQSKLDALGGVWVSGGNVFVLRQAMRLSGMDELVKSLAHRKDFLYGGYSAGCCVLSPSLKGYALVDDPTDLPYAELREPLWDGLGLIDYAFLPHYQSAHPESSLIQHEVDFCIQNNIPFKTLRDGEVVIVDV